MDINNLTIGQAKELAAMFGQGAQDACHPYQIGENYLIRTVTMTLFGKLLAVYPQELVLQDAAWIADSGRWMDALRSGCFDEVEPFPDGDLVVGRGSIIDAVKLPFSLLREQK